MVKRSWSIRRMWLIAACWVASTAWGNELQVSPPKPPNGPDCPVLQTLTCVPHVTPWIIDRPFGLGPTKLPGSEVPITSKGTGVENVEVRT